MLFPLQGEGGDGTLWYGSARYRDFSARSIQP